MAITTNGGAGVTADAVATLSNKTLEAPVINNATFTGAQSGLEIAFGQYIVFEGTTADAYELTLSAGEPTADRTITLPNSTGTVALTSDLSSYITASSTDTLTNKTLTAPKFADSGFIADANGNELISFPSTVASAVNQVQIENAATGDGVTTGQPTIRVQGNDTNISLNLVPKGSGVVQANGVALVTTSGTQTLTNKTISGSSNTLSNIANSSLTNSSITINGSAVSLGGSVTIQSSSIGEIFMMMGA